MARKAKKNPESKNDSLIQMMTISLFIILLAFFILLNSIAKVNEKKRQVVIGSIVEHFGGEMRTETTGSMPEEVFTNGVSPVDLSDLAAGDVPAMKDISVNVSRKKTTLSIPNDVLFSEYNTQINAKSRPVLDKLIGIIKSNTFPVDISGHTDDIPLPGRIDMDNRELSTLRSVNVMEYLVSHKVPPEQLTAYGWGMERPAAPNTTSKTRRLNQRIDITFTHDKSFDTAKGFFLFKDFFFNVKDQ